MTSQNDNDSKDSKNSQEEYDFGDIKEFSLEEIEAEILNDSVYLDVFAGSDIELKKDIKPLENSLKAIHQLNGIKYHYQTEKFSYRNLANGQQVGLVAQEVEKVLPEIVRQEKDGLLSVNYGQLTPLLVEGIKELSNIVEKQNAMILKLEDKINKSNL